MLIYLTSVGCTPDVVLQSTDLEYVLLPSGALQVLESTTRRCEVTIAQTYIHPELGVQCTLIFFVVGSVAQRTDASTSWQRTSQHEAREELSAC